MRSATLCKAADINADFAMIHHAVSTGVQEFHGLFHRDDIDVPAGIELPTILATVVLLPEPVWPATIIKP
jgi:hypothetical protein